MSMIDDANQSVISPTLQRLASIIAAKLLARNVHESKNQTI